MIRKGDEVDPVDCFRCGGTMRVVAFHTEHRVVDQIIDRLKPTFAAEKPPPAWAFQDLDLFADPPGRISLVIIFQPEGRGSVGSWVMGAGIGRLDLSSRFFTWPTHLDIARGPEYVR